ncbi:RES domain-containing protein [Arsenicicoccus dermatophilus]|uniref:RES domain-containing protein n=1 Tax=Arsenicicoccus dermatophilus TaxID=1076331 RepID=UPI0039170A8B
MGRLGHWLGAPLRHAWARGACGGRARERPPGRSAAPAAAGGRARAPKARLEALGEELTKPVLPRTAAYEYVPSQYLCEFIKNCGFDGVLYQSSVGDGVNLALFEPSEVACEDVSAYLVRKVGVTVEASKT